MIVFGPRVPDCPPKLHRIPVWLRLFIAKIPALLLLCLLGAACQSDDAAEQGGASSATSQNAAMPAPAATAQGVETPAKPMETEKGQTDSQLPSGGGAEITTGEAGGSQGDATPAEEAEKENERVAETAISPLEDNDVPLSPEERSRADKILAFCNQALSASQSGYFALPDILYVHAQFYRHTWHLPKRPKIPGRDNAVRKLTPAKGIFDQREAKDLAAGLEEMDKALEGMLGHYRELKKYVDDDSIRDDGKRGKELAGELERGHAVFMKARRSWLDMVEANAAKAEKDLLRKHPLQRQILAASGLFAQFREAGRLLKMETPERPMLEAVDGSIQALLATAEKPPFNASPDLERLYRAFLREAKSYAKSLETGLAEGFFAPQKREIAIAAKKCQAAYNKFAEAANRLGR